MLKAIGVVLQADAYKLLDNFSAQFAPAELVMVVGANGAGKTTLLRCLSGELMPTHGTIEFANRPLSQWPRNELARVRAVLPQHSSLDFPFSVRDTVLMGRIPHATSDAENRTITAAVLALCDCTQFAEYPYTQLSGGQQQRVQIARVIAQIYSTQSTQPRFLLLDEPISGLDLSHQYALMRLLKRLSSIHKIGIVCALHDLNLAAQFADRTIVMAHGKLFDEGTPMQVFTAQTLRTVFNIETSVQNHPHDASIPLLIAKLGDADS